MNIDSVVIAEEPKLAQYIPQMKRNIARILKIKPEKISIKAKTNEKLDSLGKKQAIAAHAVASLKTTIS